MTLSRPGDRRTAADATGAGPARPLSPVERWYWIADQVSTLNVVGRVRADGRLTLPDLRRGLDALQRRHPLLRVAIAVDGNSADPRFVSTGSPIPLRHVPADDARPGPPDRWWEQEVDRRELAEPVDWRRGPLVRAVVLDHPAGGHDLLVTVPHCVADGTTVLALLRDWVEFAARPAAVTDGAVTPDVESAPVRPPAERMLPWRHRGWAGRLALARKQRRDGRDLVRHRPRRVEPSLAVPFAQRQTRLVHRELTRGQVDALARACRRENTTVHGALAAAMVAAVARDAGPVTPGAFSIGSPIDFRSALTPPVSDREVGSYVATVPSIVGYRPDGGLWPMARTVSRDLARRRARGEHFAMVNLVTRACPPTVAAAAPFLEFMEASGPINLCLSNLGRYDFPAEVGPVRLSGAQFVAGISVSGYLVGTVNTSHDRLFWNFTYIDRAMPTGRVERIADDAVHAVLSACDGPAGKQILDGSPREAR
ncbi:condensation domain-containing protein [Micromonospora sp. WMMD882]|uniref:phthiocerol/phthiodiolone dimycocerosyl transferase family protein n=1 Tax=Micromonospora sp. WMMD882 TaxID=3015151 RepID=UPI00248B5E29|nr:condensation domain-containing protein [Micromonospora sp. WMMD882]WBB80297.1 condensation domain-containing protein [Micromonospora sp. WMMD882]